MNVTEFWTGHTVRDEPFRSVAESLAFLQWRSDEYPLFHELMGLWGDHAGQTILDYGCGPANDMVGLLTYSGATRVVGADVSERALDLARRRLDLHGFDASLVRVSDPEPAIPLDTGSIDFVHCLGVLQHVSYPAAILAEFVRVLRPGGEARIMVYNRASLWWHLYVPWQRQLLDGHDADLPIEEAFRRSTDTESCPISRAYEPREFVRLCADAGLQAEFLGGYFAGVELDVWRRYAPDTRLAPEHRRFLAALEGSPPMYRQHYAGIGGVYRAVRA